MNNNYHYCYVCQRCKAFADCVTHEGVRICENDFSIRLNSGLKPQYKCYSPCECGVDLCNITCFKEKENSYE